MALILYTCRVPFCPGSKVQSSDRRAIFRHYLTHLKPDLEDTAALFGIPVVYDNRYSIINSLIEFSKIKAHDN